MVRLKAKPQQVNMAVRAVDTASKHVAVTVDTVGHATIQTMPHPDLLCEINYLKSQRDSHKKVAERGASWASAYAPSRTRPSASS